jgi:hypothetical protein
MKGYGTVKEIGIFQEKNEKHAKDFKRIRLFTAVKYF